MKNKKDYKFYKDRLNVIYDEAIKNVEYKQLENDRSRRKQIHALNKKRKKEYSNYEKQIDMLEKDFKHKAKDAKNLCKIGEQPPEQELERLRKKHFPDSEIEAQNFKEHPTYVTANQLIAIQRKRRLLPQYTMGEEVFNSVTHIVGGGLGVIGLIVGVVFAAMYKTPFDAFLMSILGVVMVILYTMSSIYHALPIGKAKQVFQIIDHCTIYIMILGTYVPICFMVLKDTQPYNIILFSITAFLSVLGVVLNATMMRKMPVKVISNILYIVIGWGIIIMYNFMVESIGITGTWFIVGGGIAYTIGAILYGIGHNIKWFHSIFHIFVITGTILQFLGILLYGIIGI
ncbi:MAG: hemolysin III family protein [Bacilli bacterium]